MTLKPHGVTNSMILSSICLSVNFTIILHAKEVTWLLEYLFERASKDLICVLLLSKAFSFFLV